MAVLPSLSLLAGVLAGLGFHDQSVITRDIPTDQIGLTRSFEQPRLLPGRLRALQRTILFPGCR
jgi:hypothetical protein